MTTLSPGRRGSGSAVPNLQRVVLLPGAVVTLLGGGTAAWLIADDPTGQRRTAVLAAVAAVAVLTLIAGMVAARAAQRRLDRAAAELDKAAAEVAATVSYGDERLRRTIEDLREGRSPQPVIAPAGSREHEGRFGALITQLEYSQLSAYTALTEAADLPAPSGAAAQQVTVLVNLARRLQSLVHQGIKILDELEQQVEDPDLLRGLFEVDHIATRIRRYVENVAVLGGEVTRRQWRKPVPVASVVRSAIGEVERYSRVKPVPPIDGELDGAAVADVVHLLAELIENATAFSPPGTQVYVRTQRVNSGLVVEVEDRGLGQQPEDERMRNALLANPERVELGALLKDGRVGLYVVAVLARHHQIRVELRRNIFGGVTSLVLLPNPLLSAATVAAPMHAAGETERIPAPEIEEAHGRPAVAAVPAEREPARAAAAAAPQARQSAPQDPRRTQPQSQSPAAAPAQEQAYAQAYGQSRGQQSAGAPEPFPVRRTPQSRTPQGHAPASPSSPAHPQAYAQTAVRTPAHARPEAPAPSPAPIVPSVADDGRPPLPQRTQQAHLAPQLQRPPQQSQRPSVSEAQDSGDYSLTPANPGLMATYRRGVRAAEEQAGISDE